MLVGDYADSGWKDGVDLVGVSMGGMISLELALLRPTTFKTL